MGFEEGLFGGFGKSDESIEYTVDEINNLSDVFDTQDTYSIHDIDSGDDKLALTFNSRNSIILYSAFDKASANVILRDKEKVSPWTVLFEYPLYANIRRRNLNSFETSILQFDVDLSDNLDLLNVKNLKSLQEFYKIAIKQKIIENGNGFKENIDKQCIRKFYDYLKNNNKQVFNSVRTIVANGKLLYKDSNFRESTYIKYTILNAKCIKAVAELK